MYSVSVYKKIYSDGLYVPLLRVAHTAVITKAKYQHSAIYIQERMK